MSYHLDRLPDSAAQRQRLRRPVPVAYPTYPLALAPPPPERQGMDPLLKALAVALAIAVVLYLIDRMTRERADAEPVKPNPGKKMSTRDMAKKLYERLEKNGDVNDTTMRSLAQLGRKRR